MQTPTVPSNKWSINKLEVKQKNIIITNGFLKFDFMKGNKNPTIKTANPNNPLPIKTNKN